MFDPIIAQQYHQQRLKELMKQAAEARLAEVVQHSTERNSPRYYKTLAAVGRQLCQWGEQLQERYNPVELTISQQDSRI
jgi:hypothetical protein